MFVCIDAMGNVLHAKYLDSEHLSVVYLPGWYYEVAAPAFDLTVENRIRGAAQTIARPQGGEPVEYEPLAFGYAFAPARGFGITETETGAATDPEPA